MFEVLAAKEDLYPFIWHSLQPDQDSFLKEEFHTRNQAKKKALTLIQTKYKDVRIFDTNRSRFVWYSTYKCVCYNAYARRGTCFCIPFDTCNREEELKIKKEAQEERKKRRRQC